MKTQWRSPLLFNKGGGGGGTAVEYIGESANPPTLSSSSFSITYPSGVEEGDLLVLYSHIVSGSAVPATPADWTSHGSRANAVAKLAIWTRFKGAADTAVTIGAASSQVAGIFAFRNVTAVDVCTVYAFSSGDGSNANQGFFPIRWEMPGFTPSADAKYLLAANVTYLNSNHGATDTASDGLQFLSSHYTSAGNDSLVSLHGVAWEGDTPTTNPIHIQGQTGGIGTGFVMSMT